MPPPLFFLIKDLLFKLIITPAVDQKGSALVVPKHTIENAQEPF